MSVLFSEEKLGNSFVEALRPWLEKLFNGEVTIKGTVKGIPLDLAIGIRPRAENGGG